LFPRQSGQRLTVASAALRRRRRGVLALAASLVVAVSSCSSEDLEEAEEPAKQLARDSLEVAAGDKMVGKALTAARHGESAFFMVWLIRIAEEGDSAEKREMVGHLDRAYAALDEDQWALVDVRAGSSWSDLSDTEKLRVGGVPASGNALFRVLQRQIQNRVPKAP
jgi:hypothetical protein